MVNNSSPRRSKKMSFLVVKAPTNSTRTVRLVDGPKSIQSCVPGSVKLVDKYEDKDKKRRHRSNKNGETREWTTVHPEDRKRCLVWSRGHQALNKKERPVDGSKIHPKLRVCL